MRPSELLPKTLEHLAADEWMSSLVLAHEEQRDIADMIKKGLSQTGILVLVRIGNATTDAPDAPYPVAGNVPVLIDVTENPILHRAGNGRTALQLAERIAWLMHWPAHAEASTNPQAANRARRLAELQTTFQSLSSSAARSLVTWQVRCVSGAAAIEFPHET